MHLTFCRLERYDTLDEVPQNKKTESCTGLLLDKLHKQDFAGPLACRASRVLGLISRHRVADILPHMKSVSRASRPGLFVGFLRTLCNGLCTARRFHTAENDHTCRIRCQDEPVSIITMSVPGCFTSLFHSGDMLRYCHQETTCYTSRAFNMVLWFWASLTHLFMPIINTALILQTLGILVIV